MAGQSHMPMAYNNRQILSQQAIGLGLGLGLCPDERGVNGCLVTPIAGSPKGVGTLSLNLWRTPEARYNICCVGVLMQNQLVLLLG